MAKILENHERIKQRILLTTIEKTSVKKTNKQHFTVLTLPCRQNKMMKESLEGCLQMS